MAEFVPRRWRRDNPPPAPHQPHDTALPVTPTAHTPDPDPGGVAGPTPPPRPAAAAAGGFTDDVKAALLASPALAGKGAALLLDRHFPETYHPDILQAVGLDLTTRAAVRRRAPAFRKRILTAYEYRCAVCGFHVRPAGLSVALDAAHVRWVQAEGPDEEQNDLALCVLHYKLFDLGAFTVGKDGRVLVSEQAHGTGGFDETLLRHHGREARRPQRPEWDSAHDHLDWHAAEVFRGAARGTG